MINISNQSTLNENDIINRWPTLSTFISSFPPHQKIPEQIVEFDPNIEAWKRLPPPTTVGGGKDDTGTATFPEEHHWECIDKGLYFQEKYLDN